MVLGLAFRRIGWIDEAFASKLNQFVFRVPLPLLVFEDLATVDFSQIWNVKFVLFCFVATLLSILLCAGISMLWKDRAIRGEFIQASYRSSAALLGIAFIQNIYGSAGMGPLMIIGSVPPVSYTHLIVCCCGRIRRPFGAALSMGTTRTTKSEGWIRSPTMGRAGPSAGARAAMRSFSW